MNIDIEEELAERRRIEMNRKRRERYHNDPEFRAKCLQRTKDWVSRQDPEEYRAAQRLASKKYEMTHPERAEIKKKYMAAWRQRKKEEKLRDADHDHDAD